MNISYLGKLNDDQRKAVIEENKKVCVIAGPGCGKTKTLVSRLTYLLEKKKISKDRILVLTFAKKAIKEIKKRVYEVTNLKESDELNIHNFHSFCFKLISKNSELLKLKNNGRFPVYDRSEQEFVIKKILQKRDIEDNKVEINSIISFINNVKNKKIKINRDLLTKKSEFIRNEIYEDYQEYLKINGAFDFNDLILFTIKILKENEEIRKAYERKFSYILLDEFQDINSIQWEIIKLISEGGSNSLFIVGDPNQSIYGFQGSNPSLITSFIRDKKWKKIFLDRNYRSTKKIIDLANSFVKKNDQLVKNLLKSSGKEGTLVVKTKTNVSNIIRKIRLVTAKEKMKLSDIAILYRNNYLSGKIEQELIRNRIPYEILGSFKFIEREEIKDVICLIKSVIYRDNVSVTRLILMQERIGSKSLTKIEEASTKSGKTIFENLRHLIKEDLELSTKIEKKVIDLIKKIIELHEEVIIPNHSTMSLFVMKILNTFDYWEILKRKKSFKDRERNINQFLLMIQNWEKRRKKNYSNLSELINDFCQWIVIAFEDKKMTGERNNLILSSIHQSKGLEFDIVFLLFLDFGTMPYRATDDITEEKRLFYVGITRPRNALYLVSSKERVSPFLEDLDQNLISET